MAAQLLAFGHSHLGAVQKAYVAKHKGQAPAERNARFVRLNHPTFQPNFQSQNGRNALTKEVARRLRFMVRKDNPKAILLAPMGNGYNAMAMLRHPRPFNFHWPEMQFDETGMEGAEEIPFDLMKAQMRDMAENEALAFWREFNAFAECPVYLLLPPPPISDEKHILTFPGAFAERAKKYGLSPAGFRLKMHMLYTTVISEAIKGSGTVLVESPAKALDQGYLAQKYWSEDPTHGNPDYGSLILDKLGKLTGLEF